MALTASATEQAEHWKSVPGIGKTELWLVPYETIRRRSQLAPQDILGQLGEFMRFYALPDAPLAKGRLLHIKGLLSGQEGATGFYQLARPPFEELASLSQLPSIQDLDKMKQDLSKMKNDLVKANNDPSTAPSPFLQSQKQELDEKMADVNLAAMAKKLEEEYTNILIKIPKFKSEEEKKTPWPLSTPSHTHNVDQYSVRKRRRHLLAGPGGLRPRQLQLGRGLPLETDPGKDAQQPLASRGPV